MESIQRRRIPAENTNPFKFRVLRKDIAATKPKFNEPSNSRKNRVFGTVKSTNLSIEEINPKPLSKSSFPVMQNPPMSTYATKIDGKPTAKVAEKKSRENSDPNLKKKSVAESSSKNEKMAEPRTPVTFRSKLKNSYAPYSSAEKCDNCWFDELETSSYWLNQIKLAEFVGKHFASAAFFRLAHESKAEPFGNLLLELKRYLNRHEHLLANTKWRDLCLRFGVSKNDAKHEALKLLVRRMSIGT